MADFDKTINASDLEDWIIETFPNWCEGDIRAVLDYIDEMPSVQPDDGRSKCRDCQEFNCDWCKEKDHD